jgi:hypothetical protein
MNMEKISYLIYAIKYITKELIRAFNKLGGWAANKVKNVKM